MWWLVLLGTLPLVLYAVVEWKYGMKAGVIAAIVLALLELAFTYFYLDIWDPSIAIAIVLLAGLGALSLIFKKPIFIRLLPAIMDVALAGIVAYFQYWDTPIAIKYMDRVSALPDFQNVEMFSHPGYRALMVKICGDLIITCLLHAAIMVYVAFKGSRLVWILVGQVGFWVMLILGVLLRTMITGVN